MADTGSGQHHRHRLRGVRRLLQGRRPGGAAPAWRDGVRERGRGDERQRDLWRDARLRRDRRPRGPCCWATACSRCWRPMWRPAGAASRGIRNSASYDADPEVLGPLNRVEAGLYPARGLPEGVPAPGAHGAVVRRLAAGAAASRRDRLGAGLPRDRHRTGPRWDNRWAGEAMRGAWPSGSYGWRANIRELAKSPNVNVKLGGLAMAFCNFPSFLAEPRASSERLAQEWRALYRDLHRGLRTGPLHVREQLFPVDMGSCSYATLWNTFKRLPKAIPAPRRRPSSAGRRRTSIGFKSSGRSPLFVILRSAEG